MNEPDCISLLHVSPECGSSHDTEPTDLDMADNEYLPAINRMVADVEKKEAEIGSLKRTVNTLCGYANLPARYPNIDDPSAGIGSVRINPGKFHKKPLATAVGEFLKMRGDPAKGGVGPATIDEIYAALLEGGFKFDAKNDSTAKRSLAISLAKNTATFERLQSGHIGMRTWYHGSRGED
jgi:hypothetical protein